MENRRVLLALKDEKLASAVAKGLACCSSGFSFKVTDLQNLEELCLDDFTLIISDHPLELPEGSPTLMEAGWNEDGKLDLSQGADSVAVELNLKIGSPEWVEQREELPHCTGFISTDSGVGCSSLSIATAWAIWECTGDRVMWVSLCPVNKENFLTGVHITDSGMAMDSVEFLYRLWKNQDFPIQHMIEEHGGISLLRVPRYNPRSGRITVEMIKHFVRLAGKAQFDHLVFDMGNHLYENTLNIAKEMDNLVIVLDEDNGEKDLYAEVDHIIHEVNRDKLFFTVIGEELEDRPVYAVPGCKEMVPSVLDRDYGTQVIRFTHALLSNGDRGIEGERSGF